MSELALLGGESAVTLERPLWPQLGAPEVAALNAAVEASHSDVNFLNSMPGEGPVASFEAHLRAYYGRGYAVATNSCAAALQMALYAAGVSAGDEVVVSPYTWGQTVSPILHQLGIPIFADIDPTSYCMRPDAVEAAIGERTKAILVVHIYGHPADMDPILEVARRYGLPVIEDCAQAMGARYKDRKVGTLGDLACFSFGDGKQIVGGDGGCVLTDDQRYRDRLVEIGSHPLRQQRDIEGPDVAPYIDSLTYTYRMHPLAAVLVDKQLDFLETWHAERRANHQRLSSGPQRHSGRRAGDGGDRRGALLPQVLPVVPAGRGARRQPRALRRSRGRRGRAAHAGLRAQADSLAATLPRPALLLRQ